MLSVPRICFWKKTPTSSHTPVLTVILNNATGLPLECFLPVLGIPEQSSCQKLPEQLLSLPALRTALLPTHPATTVPRFPSVSRLITLYLLASSVRCYRISWFCHRLTVVQCVPVGLTASRLPGNVLYKCKFLGLPPSLVDQRLRVLQATLTHAKV